MNNLVKPLQWEEISNTSTDCLWEAKFPRISCHYYTVSIFIDNKIRCSFTFNSWGPSAVLWQEKGFSTVKEAKAACDKHYQEFVLSLLSPEATGLLLKHDF